VITQARSIKTTLVQDSVGSTQRRFTLTSVAMKIPRKKDRFQWESGLRWIKSVKIDVGGLNGNVPGC
jgi:hypothetical protein